MNQKWYQLSKIYPKEAKVPEGINVARGVPKVSLASWNVDPNRVLVDMNEKGVPIPTSDRRAITDFLHDVGRKYWEYIPLDEIFKMLEGHGIVPLQEDGTRWSGWLLGDKECGSPGSEDQRTLFQLAIRQPDGLWALSKNGILITWCTLNGTGTKKYEIVSYVS
ncbi:MAG: hypothetical protein M0R32_03205 [Candidatus Cloacimonetes bacterium]|jgi:hypothetical protein|nr:hypothetical protein [Candidatus Cloacimonadota bacterium]